MRLAILHTPGQIGWGFRSEQGEWPKFRIIAHTSLDLLSQSSTLPSSSEISGMACLRNTYAVGLQCALRPFGKGQPMTMLENRSNTYGFVTREHRDGAPRNKFSDSHTLNRGECKKVESLKSSKKCKDGGRTASWHVFRVTVEGREEDTGRRLSPDHYGEYVKIDFNVEGGVVVIRGIRATEEDMVTRLRGMSSASYWDFEGRTPVPIEDT